MCSEFLTSFVCMHLKKTNKLKTFTPVCRREKKSRKIVFFILVFKQFWSLAIYTPPKKGFASLLLYSQLQKKRTAIHVNILHFYINIMTYVFTNMQNFSISSMFYRYIIYRAWSFFETNVYPHFPRMFFAKFSRN